ncbi:MAG: hypothetical protein U0X73_01705 [Thermoanaerobaculia bacterium]
MAEPLSWPELEPAALPAPSPRPAPAPLRTLVEGLRLPLGGRVRTARELVDAPRPGDETLAATARFVPLGRLLPGGLPRGELAELVAGRSSGRFALVLELLAAATRGGWNAALVDLGDNLDPQQAAACGVDLARLLWTRPRHLKQALAASEAILAGGFALCVLDLGPPPVAGGRGAEAQWLRLAHAARGERVALVVASPYRATGTAASTVLALERERPVWLGAGREPRLLAARSARLVLERERRNALAAPRAAELACRDPLLPAP